MGYPPEITVTPLDRAGNGFARGKCYIFRSPNEFGLYQCRLNNGWVRYECYETLISGERSSPHLWDGTNWPLAGKWQLLKQSRVLLIKNGQAIQPAGW